MSGHALHPEAYGDLDDIRGYIAQHDPDAADRVITEIFDAIRALAPFPYKGHRRPDLTSRPLRFILVRDYLIAYAPRRKAAMGYRSHPRTSQPPRDGCNTQKQRLALGIPRRQPPWHGEDYAATSRRFWQVFWQEIDQNT